MVNECINTSKLVKPSSHLRLRPEDALSNQSVFLLKPAHLVSAKTEHLFHLYLYRQEAAEAYHSWAVFISFSLSLSKDATFFFIFVT